MFNVPVNQTSNTNKGYGIIINGFVMLKYHSDGQGQMAELEICRQPFSLR